MSQPQNQFPKRPRLSDPPPTRRTQNKTELCLNFQRGCCNYGGRCCFVHGHQELKRFEIVPVDENKHPRTKPCWRFTSGEKCQFGERCHFLHAKKWKTKLCYSWIASGGCRYGGSCCFAHGESELQKQGFNDGQDSAGGGLCKLDDKRVEGRQLKVKWENFEKISGVYADWISDMPLVFHAV